MYFKVVKYFSKIDKYEYFRMLYLKSAVSELAEDEICNANEQ